MTKIDLRSMAGDIVGNVEVPFTAEEAELLRSIYETDREALVKDAAAGSGLVRDLYLDWPVPWGYNLRDRDVALEQIRRAEGEIAGILEKLEKTGWQSVLKSEKKNVENALRTVLEKLSRIPEVKDSPFLADFVLRELKDYVTLDGEAFNHANSPTIPEGEEEFALNINRTPPLGLNQTVAKFYQRQGFQIKHCAGAVYVKKGSITVKYVVITGADSGYALISVKQAS